MKNDKSEPSSTVNQQRAGKVIDDIWSTFPNVHLRVLTAEKGGVEIQICDCGMSGQCRPQGWARIEKHNRQRLADAIIAAPVVATDDVSGKSLCGCTDHNPEVCLNGEVDEGARHCHCKCHVPTPAEELAEARKTATQYFRWAYQLLLALAKRRLADANAENEAKGEPNNWPAGQEWHEMVGSSHSIFLRGARNEAGIPEDAFMAVIRSLEIDVDDLYVAALRTPVEGEEK